MSSQDSSGKIPSTIGRQLRAQVASIGIKLTLAGEQLKQTTDPVEAQAVRDHILTLKAEARELVDKYKIAKSLYENAGAGDSLSSLDPILVLGERDEGQPMAGQAPPAYQQPPIYDQAEALAMEANPLILEISEMSLPRTSGEYQALSSAPEGAGIVLDAVSESLNMIVERGSRSSVDIARGGRLGQALAWSVDVTSGQTLFGVYIPALSLQLSTVALVLEYGGSEDMVIAAALDAAADGQHADVALQEIKVAFGADVAELVEWSSWLKQIDPWEHRDRAWAKTIGEAPPQSLVIGICWRMASLAMLSRRYRSGGTGALERAGRERDRLLWCHRALAKAFRTVEMGPLVDAWELVIADLENRGTRGV